MCIRNVYTKATMENGNERTEFYTPQQKKLIYRMDREMNEPNTNGPTSQQQQQK